MIVAGDVGGAVGAAGGAAAGGSGGAGEREDCTCDCVGPCGSRGRSASPAPSSGGGFDERGDVGGMLVTRSSMKVRGRAARRPRYGPPVCPARGSSRDR